MRGIAGSGTSCGGRRWCPSASWTLLSSPPPGVDGRLLAPDCRAVAPRSRRSGSASFSSEASIGSWEFNRAGRRFAGRIRARRAADSAAQRSGRRDAMRSRARPEVVHPSSPIEAAAVIAAPASAAAGFRGRALPIPRDAFLRRRGHRIRFVGPAAWSAALAGNLLATRSESICGAQPLSGAERRQTGTLGRNRPDGFGGGTGACERADRLLSAESETGIETRPWREAH